MDWPLALVSFTADYLYKKFARTYKFHMEHFSSLSPLSGVKEKLLFFMTVRIKREILINFHSSEVEKVKIIDLLLKGVRQRRQSKDLEANYFASGGTIQHIKAVSITNVSRVDNLIIKRIARLG